MPLLGDMDDPSCQLQLSEDESNEMIPDDIDEEVFYIEAQLFPSDGKNVYTRLRNSSTSLFQRTARVEYQERRVGTQCKTPLHGGPDWQSQN